MAQIRKIYYSILILSFFVSIFYTTVVKAEFLDQGMRIPHVSECTYCKECWQSDPNAADIFSGLQGLKQLHLSASDELDYLSSFATPLHDLKSSDIGPARPHLTRNTHCHTCYGCDTSLVFLRNETTRFAHVTFNHGIGATNSWLFYAYPKGSSRRYIIKAFCFPFPKTESSSNERDVDAKEKKTPRGNFLSRANSGDLDFHSERLPQCNRDLYLRRIRVIQSIYELAEDCGSEEVLVRSWVGPIFAVVPSGPYKGFVVNWHVLWMEEAPGATLLSLNVATSHFGARLLTEKMNKTQVVMQTVMDLLTAQCDRHSENVFIGEDGNMKFIDNDRALGELYGCGADSILVPGSLNYNIARLGYDSSSPIFRFYERAIYREGPLAGGDWTDEVDEGVKDTAENRRLLLGNGDGGSVGDGGGDSEDVRTQAPRPTKLGSVPTTTKSGSSSGNDNSNNDDDNNDNSNNDNGNNDNGNNDNSNNGNDKSDQTSNIYKNNKEKENRSRVKGKYHRAAVTAIKSSKEGGVVSNTKPLDPIKESSETTKRRQAEAAAAAQGRILQVGSGGNSGVVQWRLRQSGTSGTAVAAHNGEDEANGEWGLYEPVLPLDLRNETGK
eukprot:CAMPEP_0175063584 /NCGR_PEP_ID=MMETSP0052_2-20121109/14840_1 /TAXON_ID=51329 ORGANISM="Polytomella parva, Strain SAG 63-3" /NCGR_SAMPLE_ID=MMETSP0052_2 /ASSEMBLY_ACC=CAM_ASM_000194 /LENGTH=609 /DNA_ID=CAMNT_0016329803 /DNA_START=205 /DNA_END=2031 /DNA_ORIENTATION=-